MISITYTLEKPFHPYDEFEEKDLTWKQRIITDFKTLFNNYKKDNSTDSISKSKNNFESFIKFSQKINKKNDI